MWYLEKLLASLDAIGNALYLTSMNLDTFQSPAHALAYLCSHTENVAFAWEYGRNWADLLFISGDIPPDLLNALGNFLTF